MSLDVVSNRANLIRNTFPLSVVTSKVYEKWNAFPYSEISHHGEKCCRLALDWLHGMDVSNLNGASKLNGPRWITAKYSWGPTVWPIFWCDAVTKKSLDCGAQSHIAKELFTMRGLESYQVQLIQTFSKQATDQWADRWTTENASTHWITDNSIYHECCAVVTRENQIKIWDGSAGCWVSEIQTSGYGAVRALRLFSAKHQQFAWGDHQINPNEWLSLDVSN